MPDREEASEMPDKEDVPEKKISRRMALVNMILGGGMFGFLASIIYPIMRFVVPPARSEAIVSSVVAAKVDELGTNSGKVFRFGNRPGLLVRLSTGEYRAYSAVCAHLQCTVQYKSDVNQIWCACHNGFFNLNGEVASGPPPSSLETFDVVVRGDDVVVSRG